MSEAVTAGNLPDHEHFTNLFHEHHPVVRRVVFRVLLDEQATDDIVQTTFIKAYYKMHTFKGRSKMSTWLCRIAYNEALTYRRKNARNPLSIEDVYAPEKTSRQASDGNIMTIETYEEISTAMADIPEHLRAAITLVVLEEVPVSEAAIIMNCNQATVYWRVHKARKLLKNKLKHLL